MLYCIISIHAKVRERIQYCIITNISVRGKSREPPPPPFFLNLIYLLWSKCFHLLLLIKTILEFEFFNKLLIDMRQTSYGRPKYEF